MRRPMDLLPGDTARRRFPGCLHEKPVKMMLGHPRRIRQVSQLDVALEIALNKEQRLFYATIRDHVVHADSLAGSCEAHIASRRFHCKDICSLEKRVERERIKSLVKESAQRL